MNLRFPANPTHDMYFELAPGILYVYDAPIRSWVKIASSNVVLPLATSELDGAMTAVDLQKLNRLVMPPPSSTIIGNDCVGPYVRGTIGIYGDNVFVGVDGNLEIRNIDSVGDVVSEEHPFHIHQNTYGFDFTLNIPNLIAELKNRNQFSVDGPQGLDGPKGSDGVPGEDGVLSGPQGEQGEQGLAPACVLDIQPEPIKANAKRGLKRALTSVEPIPDPSDLTKYTLRFNRQVVGKTDASADLFNVKQQDSSWVLAVASTVGTPQKIYYIDMDLIIGAIHDKFLLEVLLLKGGYEEIVEFWIQTMSDLFDEQKAALCCALENCISKTKSNHLRRHMESVKAAALPDCTTELVGRKQSESKVQSTGLWSGDDANICEPPPPPPVVSPPPTGPVKPCGGSIVYDGGQKYPSVMSVELGTGTGVITVDYQCWSIPDKIIVKIDGVVQLDLGYRGDTRKYQDKLNKYFDDLGLPREAIVGPGEGIASFNKTSSSSVAMIEVWAPLSGTRWDFTLSCAPGTTPSGVSSAFSVPEDRIEIDPLLNVSDSNSVNVNLAKGRYSATLRTFGAQINGQHFADIALSHVSGGKRKQIQFLNKGVFDSLVLAKSAYEGLTLSFEHDGGAVGGFFHMIPTSNVSGFVVVDFVKVMTPQVQELHVEVPVEVEVEVEVEPEPDDWMTCVMDGSHLSWYERGWNNGICCGVVIEISGQKYIIVRKSLGSDTSCGGGEFTTTPCIAELLELGHPAFAWPTLDGERFAPIPDEVIFKYDSKLSDRVIDDILNKQYSDIKGPPTGFDIILFPVG